MCDHSINRKYIYIYFFNKLLLIIFLHTHTQAAIVWLKMLVHIFIFNVYPPVSALPLVEIVLDLQQVGSCPLDLLPGYSDRVGWGGSHPGSGRCRKASATPATSALSNIFCIAKFIHQSFFWTPVCGTAMKLTRL